jgi:ParB-like chromosome segregation protein Spo0J
MLKEKGFTWELRTRVPLSAFDRSLSLNNQARVGTPIDSSTVSRYTQALGNGDVFPAIVAAETSASAKLLICDGNHRYTAHEDAGLKSIDAYVIIGASGAAVTMLTFEANTKHGLPTSEADRIIQGQHLVDNGVSIDEAAKRLGLAKTKLTRAVNTDIADSRAAEAGAELSRWHKLPQSTKLALGRVTTDEGFVALAKLASDANLGPDQVLSAVTDLNRIRSSAKQVAEVGDMRKRFNHQLQGVRPSSAPGRTVHTPTTMVWAMLSQVKALPDPAVIAQRPMTPAQRADLVKNLDSALTHIQALRDALKK